MPCAFVLIIITEIPESHLVSPTTTKATVSQATSNSLWGLEFAVIIFKMEVSIELVTEEAPNKVDSVLPNDVTKLRTAKELQNTCLQLYSKCFNGLQVMGEKT